MFDFRYHALSLAAVLFALALGVLLGVAIGDTNLVSSAKNGVVHNLEGELSEAHRQNAAAEQRLDREEAFTKALYPLAVHELLAARNIGLVFLGGTSNEVDGLVREAVTQGAGQLATVVAVREPLNAGALEAAAGDSHFAGLESSPPLLEGLGEIVGRQLVSGGSNVEKELVGRVRSAMMSAFDGQLTHLEGLVVMRTPPSGESAAQSELDEALENGLIAGAEAVGVPVVGVELSSTHPSQVPWYKGKDLSSVDDLDAPAGRAALIYALSGSRGSFGIKSTAASLLPVVSGPGAGSQAP